MRSNSSTMTTVDAAAPDRPERALHVGGRDDLGNVSSSEPCSRARRRRTTASLRHLDVGEDAPPQRREVVGALAGDARGPPPPSSRIEPLRQELSPSCATTKNWRGSSAVYGISSSTVVEPSQPSAHEPFWLTGMAGVKTDVSLARRDSASAGRAGFSGAGDVEEDSALIVRL
jgi:hypothetical protein